MAQKSSLLDVSKGTVVFRENEPGSEAYIIVSGTVEIFRDGPAGRKILARLGPGQVFGEMALILEKPRGASVVALEDTVLRRVPAEVFCRLLSASSKKMAPLMRVLFERLRTMNARVIYEGPAAPTAKPAGKAKSKAPAGPMKVRLVGLTAESERALEEAGGVSVIKTFPFKIGRKAGSLFSGLMDQNDLHVADQEPFQVSRNHCSINKLSPDDDRCFVQDRGSHLGTVVNGLRIGGSLDLQEAELVYGRNELILGSDDSPYRFEIAVE